ncbi:hypothetical protein [Spirosoma gilvum]
MNPLLPVSAWPVSLLMAARLLFQSLGSEWTRFELADQKWTVEEGSRS